MIYYIRDEEGSLIGFKYNNTVYYYIKSMQEDIIGITDSNDNLLCSYEYDSWGKLISIKDNNGSIITDPSHIGYINPFRYRSYYYDNETKLYYLNSRYYNPEWGRFINADGIINSNLDFISYNLYVYVSNDIHLSDNSGKGIFDFASRVNTFIKHILPNYLAEKIRKNFKFEIGFGTGIGGSFSINGVGADLHGYQDITYGYDKGTSYKNVSGSYEISINDIGIEYTTETSYPLTNLTYYKYDMLNHKNLLNNEYVEKRMQIVLPHIDNNAAFLGIDASLHVGIGGHIKVGWDTEVPMKNTIYTIGQNIFK